MYNLTGLTCVIPVYKEDTKVVTKLYCELVMLGAEVIVVNDGDTVELPDDVNQIAYKPNMGYGYALKKGIYDASNEYVMTLDGDGQHTAEDALIIWNVFKSVGDCAMVVGQRWSLSEKSHRSGGRKILNLIASLLAGHYMPDLNSGLRVFRKDIALGYEKILCDTFSFTTSLTMSVVTDGHRFAYVPIHVKPRASGKSHVNIVRDGLITLFYIVKIGVALRTRGLRKWMRGLLGR